MVLFENLFKKGEGGKKGPLGLPYGPVRGALARYEPRLLKDRPKVFTEHLIAKEVAEGKVEVVGTISGISDDRVTIEEIITVPVAKKALIDKAIDLAAEEAKITIEDGVITNIKKA